MNVLKAVVALGLLALACVPASASETKADPLGPITAMLGDWTGTGDGQPGTSTATRHGARIQDDRFIMIEGRSVYPKQEKNKKGEIHTAIDIWSYDRHRKLIVKRQFDNLGFVSTYVEDKAASDASHLVMVSENLENVPPDMKARYTYEFKAPNEFRELFELDEGKGFETYVDGRYLRAKT